MNEIKIAAAVFSITRERRQAVVDSLIYGNVKSMELIGNLEALNHVDQELKDLLERQEQHDE